MMQYVLNSFLIIKYEDLYGNIGAMLDAGLGITKALEIVARNSEKAFQRTLTIVVKDIKNGSSLTEAMCRHPKLFPNADIKIIEVGELSGTLDKSFSLLAALHRLRTQTRRSIISGLTLPVMELHISAFIWPLPAFILGYISLFGYMAMALSFVFFFVYLPLAFVLIICRLSGKEGRFRHVLDSTLLRIPILGTALQDLAFARFCSVFYALHNAGIPMADCSDIATDLCNNVCVASMLEGGSISARNGYPVSEGFSDKMPYDFIELWQTGEQSGKLSEALQHLCAKQHDLAKQNFKFLGRLVPQLCMIIVILIIAFLCFVC